MSGQCSLRRISPARERVRRTSSPRGTEELLEEALREGADGIGGLDPAAVEGAAERQLDIVFGLAAKYNVAVDFHMHEEGELGLWLIRRIAERTKAVGMQGRVSICDVFGLAHLESADTARQRSAGRCRYRGGSGGPWPAADARRAHAR
jgi:cytosine deaminase